MTDAAFSLRWHHPIDKDKNTIYFVEADRGTMPIARRSLEQSSFLRKLLAYQQSWEQDLLNGRFGKNRFRVLTVTSTAQRREHLMLACRELSAAKGLFLFTDQETLAATPRTLLLPWFNAEGCIEFLSDNLPSPR